MTGEVVSALRAAGLPSLLVKGPVLVHRLYDDGASRPYVDSDLLVDPRRFAAAEQVLTARGFVRVGDEERVLPEWAQHGHELMRPEEGLCVELHWTLMHFGVSPRHVWDAFTRGSGQLSVGGVMVDVPGDPQLALHAAIHVAEHGAMPSPAEDLARALERFPFETWLAAAELAHELDAVLPFTAGLWMVDGGRATATQLGLDSGGIAAFSLDRVARARGWRAKARMALRIAFPEPAYMRSFDRPLSRLGAPGLVAAYAWRPLELAARGPRALLAYRQARRTEASGR